MSWASLLRNAKAISERFDGAPPSLAGLSFQQLLIDPASGMHIAAEFGDFPLNAPSRWKEKGFDALELRLSFLDVTQLHIRGDLAAQRGQQQCSLDLGEKAVSLEAGLALQISFRFGWARGDFFPFNRRHSLDVQNREWFPVRYRSAG